MKLLIAVDGSKASEAAVKIAAKLCADMTGPNHITLITVQDDTALKLFKKYTQKGVVDDYLREECDKNLAWSIRYLNKVNLHHDMVIKWGNPSKQIINEAKNGGFDLLIMGAKGRSVWADHLMGSVAQRVTAVSKVPVVIVKN